MADTSMIANSLGDYLRARRALVSPADVGLPPTGRRRVPGLRREEVAELVGLSTDYYVRLEQGRAQHPSDEVLDALSRALRLGSAERAHLRDLARPPRRAGATTAATTRGDVLRSALRHAVEAIPTAPAVIMNDRNDVLAWNRLAATLIADFPNLAPRERNMARRIFLDPHARQIHLDWDEAAHTTVGILRMAAGRQPHDAELVRLVGELSLGSETFPKLWASHHVHEKTHGPKRFRHPTVGDVTLNYETFQVPGAAHHLLVIYTAPPGSPAEEAMNFLSSFTTSNTAARSLRPSPSEAPTHRGPEVHRPHRHPYQ
ncbi:MULTISPECIES: helix-turn-helix transcriptional regulator [Streptomycetaceae]|uniref:DNA-binding protein n=1 Tax=Streptantibioticus cattleyicolor (strain ATCC 35852 / DSM 46488 / JCM 4925 / NBRC 14057 / NRRL 8057) TaxID=1003195 RepID=F8JRW3_STREN|nr:MULTISPECIES: helix-turn-helix transcriptional regulator [Streptomycetaceae]AEW92872.1 DNA-binding protein [Streptantibioticus cattleyicolor NRRL 8057 = DSM 46488]MYS57626.1 helix-turn-helix domain-containing protein [Streptomyces sp. SID5468]CCB73230.1 putative DNA-binding protein [Streptantibioticus cattleyicolor NRRL 8057 = DSM 46488]